MTKKQGGIIFTLLALILCVGMLAAKLNNGGLNDPTDLSEVLSADNVKSIQTSDTEEEKNKEQEQETLSVNKYFYESKSLREQQDSATIQSLKAIISDENISQEKKDAATEKLTNKTMTKDNEGRIEIGIRNKGFEDALCMLENNKATVVLKSDNGITEKDTVAIQEIVQNISNIKDVIIEVEQ